MRRSGAHGVAGRHEAAVAGRRVGAGRGRAGGRVPRGPRRRQAPGDAARVRARVAAAAATAEVQLEVGREALLARAGRRAILVFLHVDSLEGKVVTRRQMTWGKRIAVVVVMNVVMVVVVVMEVMVQLFVLGLLLLLQQLLLVLLLLVVEPLEDQGTGVARVVVVAVSGGRRLGREPLAPGVGGVNDAGSGRVTISQTRRKAKSGVRGVRLTRIAATECAHSIRPEPPALARTSAPARLARATSAWRSRQRPRRRPRRTRAATNGTERTDRRSSPPAPRSSNCKNTHKLKPIFYIIHTKRFSFILIQNMDSNN